MPRASISVTPAGREQLRLRRHGDDALAFDQQRLRRPGGGSPLPSIERIADRACCRSRRHPFCALNCARSAPGASPT